MDRKLHLLTFFQTKRLHHVHWKRDGEGTPRLHE
jgi:hypothetical protein